MIGLVSEVNLRKMLESDEYELDPNFAVVCSFLEKFGKYVGEKFGDFSIDEFKTFLESKRLDEKDLFVQLHLVMMRRIGFQSKLKSEDWMKGIIKFCKDFPDRDDLLIEKHGYTNISVSAKLRILKNLCEDQFEYNDHFNRLVNEELDTGNSIRHEPLGKDRLGRSYWFMLDTECGLRLFRGWRNELTKEETWNCVCSELEDLEDLIELLEGATGHQAEEAAENQTDDTPAPEFKQDDPILPSQEDRSPVKAISDKDIVSTAAADAANALYFSSINNSPLFYKRPKPRSKKQILLDEAKYHLPHCEVFLTQLKQEDFETYFRRLKSSSCAKTDGNRSDCQDFAKVSTNGTKIKEKGDNADETRRDHEDTVTPEVVDTIDKGKSDANARNAETTTHCRTDDSTVKEDKTADTINTIEKDTSTLNGKRAVEKTSKDTELVEKIESNCSCKFTLNSKGDACHSKTEHSCICTGKVLSKTETVATARSDKVSLQTVKGLVSADDEKSVFDNAIHDLLELERKDLDEERKDLNDECKDLNDECCVLNNSGPKPESRQSAVKNEIVVREKKCAENLAREITDHTSENTNCDSETKNLLDIDRKVIDDALKDLMQLDEMINSPPSKHFSPSQTVDLSNTRVNEESFMDTCSPEDQVKETGMKQPASKIVPENNCRKDFMSEIEDRTAHLTSSKVKTDTEIDFSNDTENLSASSSKDSHHSEKGDAHESSESCLQEMDRCSKKEGSLECQGSFNEMVNEIKKFDSGSESVCSDLSSSDNEINMEDNDVSDSEGFLKSRLSQSVGNTGKLLVKSKEADKPLVDKNKLLYQNTSVDKENQSVDTTNSLQKINDKPSMCSDTEHNEQEKANSCTEGEQNTAENSQVVDGQVQETGTGGQAVPGVRNIDTRKPSGKVSKNIKTAIEQKQELQEPKVELERVNLNRIEKIVKKEMTEDVKKGSVKPVKDELEVSEGGDGIKLRKILPAKKPEDMKDIKPAVNFKPADIQTHSAVPVKDATTSHDAEPAVGMLNITRDTGSDTLQGPSQMHKNKPDMPVEDFLTTVMNIIQGNGPVANESKVVQNDSGCKVSIQTFAGSNGDTKKEIINDGCLKTEIKDEEQLDLKQVEQTKLKLEPKKKNMSTLVEKEMMKREVTSDNSDTDSCSLDEKSDFMADSAKDKESESKNCLKNSGKFDKTVVNDKKTASSNFDSTHSLQGNDETCQPRVVESNVSNFSASKSTTIPQVTNSILLVPISTSVTMPKMLLVPQAPLNSGSSPLPVASAQSVSTQQSKLTYFIGNNGHLIPVVPTVSMSSSVQMPLLTGSRQSQVAASPSIGSSSQPRFLKSLLSGMRQPLIQTTSVMSAFDKPTVLTSLLVRSTNQQQTHSSHATSTRPQAVLTPYPATNPASLPIPRIVSIPVASHFSSNIPVPVRTMLSKGPVSTAQVPVPATSIRMMLSNSLKDKMTSTHVSNEQKSVGTNTHVTIVVGKDGVHYNKESGKPFVYPKDMSFVIAGPHGKFYDKESGLEVNMPKLTGLEHKPGEVHLVSGVQFSDAAVKSLSYTLKQKYQKGPAKAFTSDKDTFSQNKKRTRKARQKKKRNDVRSDTDTSDAEFEKMLESNEDSSSGSEDPTYDYEKISRLVKAARLSKGPPARRSSHEADVEDEKSDEEFDDDIDAVPVVLGRNAKRAAAMKRANYAENTPVSEESSEEPEVEDLGEPCKICQKSTDPVAILLCDKCDSSYHMSCLSPPLSIVPLEDWFCPICEHNMLIVALKEKLAEVRKARRKLHRKQDRISVKAFSINTDNIVEGERRSCRTKKEVSYNEAKFDQMIKKAVDDFNKEKVTKKRCKSSDSSPSESDENSKGSSPSDTDSDTKGSSHSNNKKPIKPSSKDRNAKNKHKNKHKTVSEPPRKTRSSTKKRHKRRKLTSLEDKSEDSESDYVESSNSEESDTAASEPEDEAMEIGGVYYTSSGRKTKNVSYT